MIDDLKNPANNQAWEVFEARYRPVLLGFARSLGCNPEDSADLAQQALAEFAVALRAGRYQRGQGRLGSWLIGIAQNLVRTLHRRAKVRRAAGDSRLACVEAHLTDEAHLTRIWQKEQEAAILAQAIEMLRRSSRMEEHTMRVFELYTLRGVPAEEVAAQCGIEVDSVYVIKNRLTKRLREIVHEITAAYNEVE